MDESVQIASRRLQRGKGVRRSRVYLGFRSTSGVGGERRYVSLAASNRLRLLLLQLLLLLLLLLLLGRAAPVRFANLCEHIHKMTA